MQQSKREKMLAAVVLLAALLIGAGSAHAGNYQVNNGQSIQSKLSALQPGDTLFVRAGTYNESLSFPRDGSAGRPIVMMAWPGEKVEIRSSNQLFSLNKSYWVIDGFVLDHRGADSDAIRIRGNARNSTIRNCEIINGKRDAIEVNSGRGHVIENNIIHDFVWAPGKDAHGIVTDPGVEDLQIIGNIIYDVGGDCIQLYASGSDPVSSYSKNIEIRNNIFYTTLGGNSENALDFKGVDGAVVAGNEMYGFENKAVVVQKGCRNLLFEQNVIHDSQRGMEFRGENGKDQINVTVRNNLLYNISRYYGIKFDEVTNVTCVNNTLVNISARSFLIEEEGVTNGVFRNNLVVNSEEPKISGNFQGEVSHNGWFNCKPGPMAGTGDVSGADPLFMNAGKGDYSLASGSPMRDAGMDVGLPYQGSAPDIGAFEYGATQTAVQFVSFAAQSAEDGVRLIWQTASERNNFGFAIERSRHGSEFEQVGFLRAAASESNGLAAYEFVDRKVNSGRWFYRLRQQDLDGTASYTDAVEILVGVPQSLDLGDSYPNPFSISSGATRLVARVPQRTQVQVRVYNVLGQEIRKIAASELAAGNHTWLWDGRDNLGRKVTPGIYFYEVAAGGQKAVRRLTAIR